MKKLLAITLLFLAACASKNQDGVKLTFNKAKGAVIVSGINIMDLDGIKADTLSLSNWQNLFPVFAMPADTALRNYQNPIAGKYTIANNTILFRPDTAFSAGKTYFARYYHYDEEVGGFDIVMKHRTPGKIAYSELIFKY